MPRPNLRTRSRKRVYVALPGGRNAVHHKKEVTPPKVCSNCGQQLSGTPNDAGEMRKLNQTKRKINRVYGGQLCHRCLKNSIRRTARNL